MSNKTMAAKSITTQIWWYIAYAMVCDEQIPTASCPCESAELAAEELQENNGPFSSPIYVVKIPAPTGPAFVLVNS